MESQYCPTCHRPLDLPIPFSQVEVDIDACTVRLGGVAIQVTPRQAEVLHVLKTDGEKGPVSTRQFIRRIYGTGEPDSAAYNIWTFIYQIRKRLRGTGWRIDSHGNRPNVRYKLLPEPL